MRFSFCKNSAFCVLFFISFFLGTISGVLLLRYVLFGNQTWLRDYCLALKNIRSPGLGLVIWFQLLPLLGVIVVCFLPHKDKLIFVLVFIRAAICTYAFGTYFALDIPAGYMLLHNLLFLPVYYFLCRKLWVV